MPLLRTQKHTPEAALSTAAAAHSICPVKQLAEGVHDTALLQLLGDMTQV